MAFHKLTICEFPSHSTDSSVSGDEGHSDRLRHGSRRSRGKTKYSSESGDFKRAQYFICVVFTYT